MKKSEHQIAVDVARQLNAPEFILKEMEQYYAELERRGLPEESTEVLDDMKAGRWLPGDGS